MRVDIGNALDETSPTGVSREDLGALDDRVAAAADRIETGREQREFGYVALDLPETTDASAIEAAVSAIRPAETLLTIGIGGSALGAATIARVAGGGPDRLPRKGGGGPDLRPRKGAGDGRTVFLDNVDPAHTREVVDSLDLASTAVNVVSRSGTTAETLANFLVVRDAMDRAGVDWTDRTLVTTGEAGPLRDLVDEHDLPSLGVPEGVPGRFSALSAVGLVAPAFQGADVEAILAGGRRGADGLADSLFESPAYGYGATMFALANRGAAINAMMPYAEALDPFAEWFAQLWAESLGKDRLGQTPLRALGATDQHSQLQLYRAGPADKVVTFLRPLDRPAVPIPETDLPGLAYLGESSLEELIGAEFAATEASLAAAGRPNVRIEIDALDERGIGELLYGMEAACIMAGELFEVDPFTQPAVEWGKRRARELLRGEADPSTKTRLIVEGEGAGTGAAGGDAED